MLQEKRENIRRTVRSFYDVQKLRIQFGNRTADPDDFVITTDKKGKEVKKKKPVGRKEMDAALLAVVQSLQTEEAPSDGKERPAPPVLNEEDRDFLKRQNALLLAVEADTLKRVDKLLRGEKVYDWLKNQKGCGVTLSGVIVSEIDITRANTASALWAYCGLDVMQDGRGRRKVKGQKCNYNPFLKTKLCGVLANCLLKAKSPWTEYYYNYKTRKQNTFVDVCMNCGGHGKLKKKDVDNVELETAEEGEKLVTCSNCKGGTIRPPWGRSDAHRHKAASRYMVKMFLLALWKEWRTIEGLPTPNTYAEAYLNRTHGDHRGSLPSHP